MRFDHKAKLLVRFWAQGLVKILSLVEIVMFGWDLKLMLNRDSENETWSDLCKNLWYELYPTLGSVVPLAMFSPNFLHIKITGCPKKVATRICEKLFWPIELYVLRQTNSIVVLLERKSTKATILWYMSPGHKLNKYFFWHPVYAHIYPHLHIEDVLL